MKIRRGRRRKFDWFDKGYSSDEAAPTELEFFPGVYQGPN
jgi:hypothetical protein